MQTTVREARDPQEESEEEANLDEQITLEKQRIKNYIREKSGKDGVNLSSMHNELLIKFKRLGFRRLIDFVLTVEGIEIKSMPQPTLTLTDNERAKLGAILVNEKGTFYPPHTTPKSNSRKRKDNSHTYPGGPSLTCPFPGREFSLTCMAEWWESSLGLPPTLPNPDLMFAPPIRPNKKRFM